MRGGKSIGKDNSLFGKAWAVTLRPSLHPPRTCWTRKQPTAFLASSCLLCQDPAWGALPFYIRGKEFQAIPQRGQYPWRPEVQVAG